ncbi:hypothetical protein GY45DRAFT_1369860 [Cubamyces sp. BRFM 1775]|nr:hypothetical protein GY45DRAFT_1369860 [Cubamyces sp. BRFM 1775]
MSINSCPVELLALIVERVPTDKALRSLRGVNKTFCALATPLAFRRAHVTNSLPSTRGLKAIMECHELAKAVETIVFRWSDVFASTEDVPTKRTTYIDLMVIFARLHLFPALVHVEMNLFPSIPGPDCPVPLVVDDAGNFSHRLWDAAYSGSRVLECLLRCVHLGPPPKSLTLTNLTVVPWKYYESQWFSDMLSFVEHLYVSFHGEHSIGGSHGREIWTSLWLRVVSIYFLRPPQVRLKSLTLISDQPVGRVPRLDLSGIFFPVLRHLELGGIMLEHDQRIERFIELHGKTLTELVLDSCPMYMPDDGGGPLRPWRDVCDRFSKTLEVLVDVQFHVREGWGLDNLKRTGEVRLYYCTADTTYGGVRGQDTRAYEDADRPAINRLLEKVKARREKQAIRAHCPATCST